MYFPYLKLRREEANAICETICTYNDQKVIPILEPYNEKDSERFKYKSLIKTISSLISARTKFILIINSESDLTHIKSECPDFDKYCIRGYYSDNSILNNYNGIHEIAVIHKNTNSTVLDGDKIKYHIFMPAVLRFLTYIDQYPKAKTVKIEDGFIKHTPNNSYPPADDFNSESVFTFRLSGYAGFGDFTILEEGYTVPSGAQAYTVTHVIHLTRQKDADAKLEVCHYLTTPDDEPDNRRRSVSTIEKAYNDRHRFLRTKGIIHIENKHSQPSSPAFYKRIGMIHHIELIHSLI